VQVLAQVHDAILGQYRIGRRAEALKAIKESMLLPIPITDFQGVTRTCTIDVEVAVGACWGKKNLDPSKGPIVPDGLVEVPL
jgi:hypothetical protein